MVADRRRLGLNISGQTNREQASRTPALGNAASSPVESWLNSFDPSHFEYLADVHRRRLPSKRSQQAAVALRSAYGLALESFFGLVGALVQAPHCVFGWLDLYEVEDLRRVIRSINGRAEIPNVFKKPLSWSEVSGQVHIGLNQRAAGPESDLRLLFASFWERAAEEFLDLQRSSEYNAVKHGFRLMPGGFTLSLGRQDAPGIPAPRERMQRLPGSDFGGRVLRTERIGNYHNDRRVVEFSRNWRPESIAERLQILAWSMNNVIGRLRAFASDTPYSIHYLYPRDLKVFDTAWATTGVVQSFRMATDVTEDQIEPTSAAEVAGRYGLAPEDVARHKASHESGVPRRRRSK